VYDHHYRQCVRTIREELSAKFPTLHLVGRNGMHKYNNQDHSMMTAMLTVDNILAGSQQYDVWRVNQDADYIESSLSSERSIPSSLQG
jgi:protoporphyrinogen oxidase